MFFIFIKIHVSSFSSYYKYFPLQGIMKHLWLHITYEYSYLFDVGVTALEDYFTYLSQPNVPDGLNLCTWNKPSDYSESEKKTLQDVCFCV